MIFISHRGNIDGIISDYENNPLYIDKALLEYDAEIDIRYLNGEFYLGHDYPQYKINYDFLNKRKNKLWLHCKDVECFIKLKDKYNCFFHENEKIVLTTKCNVITHVNFIPMKECICMLPELNNLEINCLKDCLGICSDVIKKYKDCHSESLHNNIRSS